MIYTVQAMAQTIHPERVFIFLKFIPEISKKNDSPVCPGYH
jgi:hypothetical protein